MLWFIRACVFIFSTFGFLHAQVSLVVYFEDGSYKEGFGAVVDKGGTILTAASLVLDERGEPAQRVVVRLQEYESGPMSAIARAEVRAVDSDRGLALLESRYYTDAFGNVRAILDPSMAAVIFTKQLAAIEEMRSLILPQEMLRMPIIDMWGALATKEIEAGETIIEYGRVMIGNVLTTTDRIDGALLLDAQMRVAGIVGSHGEHEQMLLGREMLFGFLCLVQRRGVAPLSLADSIKNECETLPSMALYSERFRPLLP